MVHGREYPVFWIPSCTGRLQKQVFGMDVVERNPNEYT